MRTHIDYGLSRWVALGFFSVMFLTNGLALADPIPTYQSYPWLHAGYADFSSPGLVVSLVADQLSVDANTGYDVSGDLDDISFGTIELGTSVGGSFSATGYALDPSTLDTYPSGAPPTGTLLTGTVTKKYDPVNVANNDEVDYYLISTTGGDLASLFGPEVLAAVHPNPSYDKIDFFSVTVPEPTPFMAWSFLGSFGSVLGFRYLRRNFGSRNDRLPRES